MDKWGIQETQFMNCVVRPPHFQTQVTQLATTSQDILEPAREATQHQSHHHTQEKELL